MRKYKDKERIIRKLEPCHMEPEDLEEIGLLYLIMGGLFLCRDIELGLITLTIGAILIIFAPTISKYLNKL